MYFFSFPLVMSEVKISKHRITLTKLRLSAHSLDIEVGRDITETMKTVGVSTARTWKRKRSKTKNISSSDAFTIKS